jgi:hypothetical protein
MRGRRLPRPVVRVRLEPRDVDSTGGHRRIERRHGRGRRASLAVADRVETAVRGDAVEPRAQGGTAFEPGEAAPGGDQGFLNQVVGVVDRAEHAIAVHVEFVEVGLGQLAECPLVSGACGIEGRGHRFMLPGRRAFAATSVPIGGVRVSQHA